MKNLKLIFLIILISLAFSCNKSEDSSIVGDVVAISKKSGTSTVYALAYYAYSYSSLKSVTVTSSLDSSTEITLSNGGYDTIFLKEPSGSDFSTTKPTAATFTFDATFENGGTYKAYDQLLATILDPPTIESCVYSSTSDGIVLQWTALTNADSYAIIIYDSSNNLIFRSSEFSSSYSKATITESVSTWSSSPVSGTTYTVRLLAYKYEDSDNPSSYNLQSTSYSDATVTWGS
jgi:hypothetical protein